MPGKRVSKRKSTTIKRRSNVKKRSTTKRKSHLKLRLSPPKQRKRTSKRVSKKSNVFKKLYWVAFTDKTSIRLRYFDKKEDRDTMYEKAKTRPGIKRKSLAKGVYTKFNFTNFVKTTQPGGIKRLYNNKRW